uniref:DHFR domain-containing protein n=1 Tax=viral metagenome TaxID=1070528 RepID=A0A6C0FH64_9ZZZZ|tara:strand:- start:297 stop:1769 length:1473 start_codon:yes stop_codon:yes gene_type:complete
MKFSIIVSVNNHNVIGEGNDLLIHSKKDLRNFQKITTEGEHTNAVIMGYNTWLSISESKRPLRDRYNIILSRNHSVEESNGVKCFRSLKDSFEYCNGLKGEIFVIGGSQIFNECCKTEHYENLNKIYLTRFDDNYHPRDTTHSFPLKLLENMKLVDQSDIQHEICSRPHIDNREKGFLQEYLMETYTRSVSFHFNIYHNLKDINTEEYQYLDLLKKVMNEGFPTEGRNSKVLSLFGERMIFDLSKGFPLLTTKHVGHKTVLRELLWFIEGSTSNKLLNEKKVRIWDGNSSREFLDSRGLDYEEGDLGPVYGFQWRHFGAEYKDFNTDYTGKGSDQLQYIIDLIKNDPHSRRIIMSAWNPPDLDKMALPPCHVMCQFYVNTNENKLDCQLYQRSGDMFLGVPFNIASYSYLTCILAKLTGYKPGRLIHILGDTHIYDSHVEAVLTQIKRIPFTFPTLTISDECTDINDIKEEYFKIENYNYHEKISAPMIA